MTEALSMYKTASDKEKTYAEMRDAIRGSAAKQKIDQEKIKMLQAHLKTAGVIKYLDDKLLDTAQKNTVLGRFLAGALPSVVDATTAANEALARGSSVGAGTHGVKGVTAALTGGLGATNETVNNAVKRYQKAKKLTAKAKKRAGQVSTGVEGVEDYGEMDNSLLDTLAQGAGYVGDLAGAASEMFKVADDHHTIVTGHSGSGKSTLSRKLSKETGLPIYAMDDDPGIRDAFFNYQKTYAKDNDGRLDLSPKRRALEDEIERRGIRKALELEAPHIIEGSHFLRRNPEEFKNHKLIMVNPSAETIAFQRTNRKKLKDLARGREWTPDIERQSRFRGQQLYDMYEDGGRADNWRKSSLVEKRAGHVEDRARERTNFSDKEIEAVRSLVKNRRSKLKKGTAYSVKFPGRGTFVVGDVGKQNPNHVVKTVLGPSMLGPSQTIKAAMFTPGSAYNMMKSKNKLVRGLGHLGSKAQIFATKPAVTKAVQAANEGAFGGPQFAVASATASGIKDVTPEKYQEILKLLGVDDVGMNHGDPVTPLGYLVGKAFEYAPQVLEAGANAFSG